MRIVAVIQARTKSTRLPGKVLLPLGGKPMLQNVIERVKRAKLIDDVVVACPFDDWIELRHHCDIDPSGFPVRDNDLVGRLLMAAKDNNADAIIRICADNPCVEGEEIDVLAKYAMENHGNRWPLRLLMNSENLFDGYDGFGGELYTLDMLKWMDEVIKDTHWREHPHEFWHDLGRVNYCGKPYPPGFRLEVNTPEEYEKLKDIYEHFGHNHFTVKEVIEYLNGKKDLAERAV